ncbi:MAG: hypothetical protein K8R53_11345 [Bacteroidales bacterium]|nr:hypothetical protein [Bacteroidales bacterium]
MRWTLIIICAVFLLSFQDKTCAQVEDILKPVTINKPPQKKVTEEQLAGEYFRNKEYDKAAELYKKLFEAKTSSIYYSYYLYCLIELKNFKEAEKVVKKQIKAYPYNTKYIVDLGYVYTESGNLNKAKKQYDEALRKVIPDKGRIIELSNAYMIRGETDYAVQAYIRGSRIMDGYPFYLELGNLFAQLGDNTNMITQYLNYVEYAPGEVQRVQIRLQNAFEKDEEGKLNEILRNTLLARIHNDPDILVYSEMLLWLSVQQKDFNMALIQAKSIDKRLSENGRRVFELAQLSASNDNYDVAIKGYEYILKKGRSNRLFLTSKVGLINTKLLKITSTSGYSEDELLDLEKDYLKALEDFGRMPVTISLMRNLAHLQAFYLDKTEEAINLLYETVEIGNPKDLKIAECKLELADILLFTGEVWEASLLYSQVEKAFKHEPAGHLAKYKNAKLSFYIGEFNWAKAQLDVLKAATSKLIANDALELSLLISDNIDYDSSTVALSKYARADLLSFRNRDDLAIMTLDSLLNEYDWHPVLDEVLYKKAQIKIKLGKYEEAALHLEEIIDRFTYDIKADNAIFTLALLNEKKFSNEEKAKELYLLLMTGYKNSIFVTQARERFRILRGEVEESEIIEEDPSIFNIP